MPLLGQLAQFGAEPTKYEDSRSFGNFSVSFTKLSQEFLVVRDRGQFIVSGPSQQELEAAGLWRAFVGLNELSGPLLAWLSAENAA